MNKVFSNCIHAVELNFEKRCIHWKQIKCVFSTSLHSCCWVVLSRETDPVIKLHPLLITAPISPLHFAQFYMTFWKHKYKHVNKNCTIQYTYTNTQVHQIQQTNTHRCRFTQIAGLPLSMPLSPLPSLHFVEFHNKSNSLSSPSTKLCMAATICTSFIHYNSVF